MSSSGMKKIAEAIKTIPEKKEKLREAFDSLQPYSSSLAPFALPWKDLEDHFAAIEKSIDERFKALQDHLKGDGDGEEEEQQQEDPKASPSPPAKEALDEATPRPELRSFCANMDAKGLRSYLSNNRNDIVALDKELAPAIRCAPDPALFVLDAMVGFYHDHNPYSRSMEIQTDRRTCIKLLEKLHRISPNFNLSVRDKAKKLAMDWKSKMIKTGDFFVEAWGFLQLIISYKLVSDFPLNDVMELFMSVSRAKQAVNLIKNLGLTDKLPDIIQELLNSKGRQLDAVKFIYAFHIADKFPPVPLLKAYITETKEICQGVLKKGNSLQAQNYVITKEMGALKSVLKAIEEYKLENEYPPKNLVKRIFKLEQRKADMGKKPTAASAVASNSKPQQQRQQPNKRPRLSPSTSAAVTAANTYPSSTQTHPQLGLADRAPYMGVAGRYGLAATGSVYNHGSPNLSGRAMGHGATHSPPRYDPAVTGSLYDHGGPNLSGSAMGHDTIRSPPRSYYSSESLVGTSSLYDRPASYGHTLSGLPPSYGSSLYP